MAAGDLPLTQPEGAWLSSTLAARALTRAADPETRNALKAAIRSWLLDVDDAQLGQVAAAVAADICRLANLIEERRDRLVAKGQATPKREWT